MQYLGGKFRIKEAISDYIVSLLKTEGITEYIEPFCGALWITCEIVKKSPSTNITASDYHESLIKMWQAIQDGWEPYIPIDSVEGEKLYNEYKATQHEHSKEHGFYGFSYGYSGKYFGGFSRSRSRNYAKDAWSSITKRKLPYMSNMKIEHCDYQKYKDVKGALIYCDPPYKGTSGYKGVEPFDHDVFWEWVRKMSKDNIVLVSECQAPDDFTAVLETKSKTDLRTGKKNAENKVRKEYLFQYAN